MAVLNVDQINAHLTNYKKDLTKAFESYLAADTQSWKKVTYETTSTGASNDYAGVMEMPNVEEWVPGPRPVGNLEATHYTVDNKTWTLAVEIPRELFYDDSSGMISQRLSSMVRGFDVHINRNIFTSYADGSDAASLCYDGTPFFGGAHTKAPATNESLGAAQPLWILMDSKIPFGGVIFQMREKPKVKVLGEGSEWAEMQNTFLFTAKARYAFGYGNYRACYMSDAEFTEANFWAAYEAMLEFVNEDGNDLGVNPDTIMFHPSITAQVRRVLMKGGWYSIDGATSTSDVVVDGVAAGLIKNLIPSVYLA